MLYTLDFGTVCGNGNGFCAGGEIGKGIESFYGGFASGGFAGGDVDFGCSCLQESEGCYFSEALKLEIGMRYRNIYPDAAWSPRPRDPPVTTTTFPFREKMLGKS